MNDKSKNKPLLFDRLNEIRQAGIRADTVHIKKDMCAQFTDPNEWIREYAVNSYDAKATFCKIRAEGKDGEVTVFVLDDGHGMDKQGIKDFFTLYRSRKQQMHGKTVGRFGIGKLSVAAIPGQKKFSVSTSTGKECWIAEAGSLLSAGPIKIMRSAEVPPQGTLFGITFETTKSPDEVMVELSKILRKYTLYLPFNIELHYPDDAETGLPGVIEQIGQDWSAASENYGKGYDVHLYGGRFEIITGLGASSNEVFQNKVLVSERYNLLSYGLSKNIHLPHLRIRVNSSAFDLPFGRHCLKNEEILGPLANTIRVKILPDYFGFLLELFESEGEKLRGLGTRLEEMAVALAGQFPDHGKQWCNIPLFRIYPHKRVSLVHLENLVTRAGKVFLEEGENTGVDYSFFDAPVLLQNQPGGGIEFLKEYFKKEMINLSLNDVVIEAPSSSMKLSSQELSFQDNLGITDDIHKLGRRAPSMDDFLMYETEDRGGFGLAGKQWKKPQNEIPEGRNAGKAFRELTWKVNYLVSRDGKTPCLSHRFIVNGNTVILNLYHPDIKELVRLSERSPKLAGHWAVAMCLTEDNRILSFLSSETREDLLLVDAMVKVNATSESKKPLNEKEFTKMNKTIRNLLRDSGFDFGLN